MLGASFNVGGDRRVAVRELAQAVVEEAGASSEPVVPGLYRVGDTRHIFSDVTALRSRGWAPRAGQREIIREYLAWAGGQPDLVNTYREAEAKMRSLGVLRRAGGD